MESVRPRPSLRQIIAELTSSKIAPGSASTLSTLLPFLLLLIGELSLSSLSFPPLPKRLMKGRSSNGARKVWLELLSLIGAGRLLDPFLLCCASSALSVGVEVGNTGSAMGTAGGVWGEKVECAISLLETIIGYDIVSWLS